MQVTEPADKIIEAALLGIAHDRDTGHLYDMLRRYGLQVLPLLSRHLSEDQPIELLEKYEAILKHLLRALIHSGVNGEAARGIAAFQQKLGFLFKYKSYALKASSPLGYSVFIQNRGEGFSFQQHVTRKTELLHILEVRPGGYVFICPYDDWAAAYDERSFSAWLSGQANPRYDRFSFRPRPGDVFILGRLHIVHSVIGCVLEEYATVSSDMADRLHNQNAGKSVPKTFTRSAFLQQLDAVSFPDTHRLVEIRPGGPHITPLEPESVPGGEKVSLSLDPVRAARYRIEPSGETGLEYDARRAASLYITSGTGRLIMADRQEAAGTAPPSIPVSAGDLLLVPPGIYYGCINDGPVPLEYSEQSIPFDVALV